MNIKNDPRLVTATRTPKAPVARPVGEALNTADSSSSAEKDRTRRKVNRRIGRSRPAWLKNAAYLLAALGVLFFVHYCVQSVNETLQQNQRNAAISDAWRQLVTSDTTVLGTPTELDSTGSPNFPFVSFEAAASRQELHRNFRLATVLPGVRAIGLSPASTRLIGRGFADNTTLTLLAANFSSLDSLSISGTKVSSLEALAEVPIRELRMVNTPISRENLHTLGMIKGVTDLWIGWEPDPRDADQTLYLSESFKRRLIEVIATMPDLKQLHTYNLAIDPEERLELPKQLKIQPL